METLMPRTILFGVLFFATGVFASDKQDALNLYQRLTGIPLQLGDPRLASMQALLAEGRKLEAALLVTEDPSFLQVTVRDFAAVISNKESQPYVDFNDLTALIIGVTRDNTDAREMMYGNFRYEGRADLKLSPVSPDDNKHYQEIEAKGYKFKDSLVRRVPQWDHIPAGQTAGLLTTRAWAEAHYKLGTNRRALQYAMQEMLCRPIVSWKDTSISDDRVRRDVPRAPSSDPLEYQSNCRGCHAPMDAMAGAFAHFDFNGQKFTYLESRTAPKMTQNGSVFPFGYVTTNSSWKNYLIDNPSFGWKGADEGDGPQSLGALLAGSDDFSRCMSRRAFRAVCHTELDADKDRDFIQKLSDSFAQDGYKLRGLFANASVRCTK
jgi:hypothetical protein